MDLETWEKGKLILESESFIHYTFYIVSGRVRISVIHPKTGREQTLFLLSEGDLFDIVAFLDGLPSMGVVRAIDNLRLLRIPSKALVKIIQGSMNFNKNFFRYLGKQMRDLENLSADLSIHDVPTRLVKQLLKHITPEENSGPLKLINDFTHDELAKLIGSTRVVVSRIMQSLRADGLIRSHRGHLEINEVNKLLKKHEDSLK